MTTEKSLRQHLVETIRLAGPLAAAQLATFTMGMVDVACVGRYSEAAMGAVAVGNAMHWAFSCLMLGIPLALDPLISQAVGQDKFGQAGRWLGRGVQLVLMVGLPLVLTEMLVSRYLTVLGLPSVLSADVHRYILARAPAMIFFQLFLVGRAYLQSLERTRPIVLAAVFTNLINLVLDVLLVFGDEALGWVGLPAVGLPALGAIGAGITTLLSTMTLAGAIWWFVRREQRRRSPSETQGSSSHSDTSRQRVLRLAWPIGLQQMAESWLFCIFGILVGRFGEVAASGYQAALTLAAAAFMLALGLASATSVRVGHAVGRGSQPDIRRAALAGNLLVLAVMGVTASAFLLFPRVLIELMSDQPAVIEIGVPLLAYAAAFALFDGVQVVMGGALRGVGDVRVPFLLGLLSYWGVGGSVGWYGMVHHGVPGIWLGLVAGLVAASILLTARWWVVTRTTIGALGAD